MKVIFTRMILSFLSLLLAIGPTLYPLATHAATASSDVPDYTTLRDIDIGTFNEYRYRLTEQFFELREYFGLHDALSVPVLQDMAVLADTAYKYLPDNLKNKNYLQEFLLDVQKGVKTPSNELLYNEIVKSLGDYLEKVDISSITGTIEASPTSGNAPLTSTFRGNIQDPTGTKILSGNYTWWIDDAGKKRILGRGQSLNYTFRDEAKHTVFLDVTSSHRNAAGYTDVLPYRSRVEIDAKEKIASVIVSVNGDRVDDNEEMKFTPSDADYGLLIDATSSTPTSGTRFLKTEWDFGNGIKRSNSGSPNIERVRYGGEGDYTVTLKLTTNENKVVEKNFVIAVHDPIAKIESSRADGFAGETFTFTAKSSRNFDGFNFRWEVIDIEKDVIITQSSEPIYTYIFANKGKYNVRLTVKSPSGEIDQDTRIIYITSQAPIAEFETNIPESHKPNRVKIDASRSYDPDVSDDARLIYNWYVNGNKILLEDSSQGGSMGYYTFSTTGTQTLTLEVIDPDGIMSTKKEDIQIDSILSVDMKTFPRVIQRNGSIRFVAESPQADIFEWDFGDGKTSGGKFDTVTHTYESSGLFTVQLTVRDKENKTNTFSRDVFVSDSESPYALLDIVGANGNLLSFDPKACDGEGAYIANRVEAVSLNAAESINIDGTPTGLDYSWKIGNSKYVTTASLSHTFDETGCFPIKLTVTSQKNGATHSSSTNVLVKNMTPTLSSLDVSVQDPNADPIIVQVTAQGAADPDGVIQSYMWYYYTDIDSEPQDFRSTLSNSTTFVIPKITGNYYFMVLMKDNNEERVTSEEVTGSRYFTTITGDNINTPIIEISASDTTVAVGEEVSFTAKAKNILGQEIVKDANYSWDFDGDGFYDTQTTTPETTYVYRKSGEFYAKVKVKYRGISSTKNITMNVANKLVADFGYISIGNKIIFFDTSDGQITERTWDLGDGNKKTGTNFTHTYTDGKAEHDVKLVISEGTNTKEVTKKVSRNMKNVLKAKEQGLNYFIVPEFTGSGIVLTNASEKVFLYMGEGNENTESFAIDYDTEFDSDLNGGLDDDEDNKGTASYVAGDIIQIPLSPYRTQKIRIFLKDGADKILASQDILIEKTYIEEQNINPDSIVFENVTESERQKIEKLKEILITLPQQQRLKALNFVQKLQENWTDSTEKTRTILDFENYIFELKLKNEADVIALLESLLVEGQEDQSEMQIIYQALINLVPKEISCTVSSGTCYDDIMKKLETIRNSTDIQANKTQGETILKVIAETDTMNNQQKLDFKALLTSLVYGGQVQNIPEQEKSEVIAETESTEGGIFGMLGNIGKWLAYIFAGFLVLLILFYGIYLLLGRAKGGSFSDFIRKTTGAGDDGENSSGVQNTSDIFEEISIPEGSKQSQVPDPLAASSVPEKKEVGSQISSSTSSASDVPDWLKGNFAKNEAPVIQNNINPPIPEKKEEVAPIPEVENPKNTEPFVETSSVTDTFHETSVPDWLKGSLDTSEKKEDIMAPKEVIPENIVLNNSSLLETPTTPLELSVNPQIPDWLQGSLPNENSSSSPENMIQDEVKNVSEEKKGGDVSEIKTKKTTSRSKKTDEKKKTENKTQEETPVKNEEELWDDGMKIPDWLKATPNDDQK